jgi:hypothetical protein
MQVTYDGAHSLLIGGIDGIHTWNDWHLIPTSMPIIAPPEVKKNTVDIPGMNGVIDMTDQLLGYPLFGQRTGSIDFYVDHTAPNWSWDQAYDTIANTLHGKKTKVLLTDSPSYQFEGRLSVNQFKSDKMCCSITIDYDLAPFKKMIWSTTDEWQWNPFDFATGIIPDQSWFQGFLEPMTATEWFTLNVQTAGSEPVVPLISAVVTTNRPIDDSATNAAYVDSWPGTRFYYRFHNGTEWSPLYNLDFLQATKDEGDSMTTYTFNPPNLTVGSPQFGYMFQYRFQNTFINTDAVARPMYYTFKFTPGRL